LERRQLRLLGALAALLLAMTLLLWFGEAPETPDPYADSDSIEVVAGFDLGAVVSMRLIQQLPDRASTVEFSKVNGEWRVDSPYSAPADPEAIVSMLDALRESERGVGVDGQPAMFGLDPPSARLVVKLGDGSERSLGVGNVAPDGARTYVAGPLGGVAAVRGTPGEPLLERVNEYRDHRVFRFDPGAVTRVSVASDLGKLEATKSDMGWFLTGFGRVDLNALDGWVVDLLSLRIDLFLDLDAAKPEVPRFTIQVETADGIQNMYIGRDTPYGPLVFFGDEGLNGTMDPGLLRMLERGPTDVGVAEAFPFDETVRRVRLTGARELEITRQGDGWTGSSDAAVVVGALQAAQLTYKRSPPVWQGAVLTVEIEGDQTHHIEIGQPDEEGFRAVRDVDGGEAVRVPVGELSAVFGG